MHQEILGRLEQSFTHPEAKLRQRIEALEMENSDLMRRLLAALEAKTE